MRVTDLSRAGLEVDVSETFQVFLDKSLGVVLSDLLPCHRVTNSKNLKKKEGNSESETETVSFKDSGCLNHTSVR